MLMQSPVTSLFVADLTDYRRIKMSHSVLVV